MGKIRARESGRLYFDFTYKGKRCREQTMLPDTPQNRRAMQRALEKIEAEITLGQFNYLASFPESKTGQELNEQRPPSSSTDSSEGSASPTFQEFYETWLSENEVRWRHSTREFQVSIAQRHLLPAFSARPVHEITKSEALAFRSSLAKVKKRNGQPLSPKTVNEIMGTLKSILDEAADRYDFSSPTERIKRLKVPRKDIQPFTIDEVDTIIQAIRPDYRNYFTVRFFTGMRSGEVHGLKWKHIDFERRQILIRETFGKGRTEYTKTDGSQREIWMSGNVYNALRAQKAASQPGCEYVFANRQGKPLDNKNFTDRVWNPILRHLGIDRRPPYQMRHTAATLWLSAGESPEWIARQLGHTSTQMLFRVYSRYVPNLTRNDGSALEQMLAARKAKTDD